jgi:hypothetical protein
LTFTGPHGITFREIELFVFISSFILYSTYIYLKYGEFCQFSSYSVVIFSRITPVKITIECP